MRTSFSSKLVAGFLVSALALPVLAPVGVAFAAPGDDPKALARARETYKDGLASEAAGKWEKALADFKEVALVKSTPQVRYHVGYCSEKMGNYVDALGSYRLALHEAREVKAKDVEQAAQDALNSLEPKIPKLTIKRGEGAQVAEVTMDGTALGNSSIGTVIPVNPGPHVIKATASGRDPFTAEFSLADAESKTVTMALDETKAPVVVAPVGPTNAEPDQPEPPPKTSPLKIAGFVGLGLGAVGLVVGGVFAAKRGSAISTLDADCGPTKQNCPASDKSVLDSGKTAGTMAPVGFIAGGALVAIGAVLIIAAPSSKKKAPPSDQPASASLVFGSPSSLAGASLVGRF